MGLCRPLNDKIDILRNTSIRTIIPSIDILVSASGSSDSGVPNKRDTGIDRGAARQWPNKSFFIVAILNFIEASIARCF